MAHSHKLLRRKCIPKVFGLYLNNGDRLIFTLTVDLGETPTRCNYLVVHNGRTMIVYTVVVFLISLLKKKLWIHRLFPPSHTFRSILVSFTFAHLHIYFNASSLARTAACAKIEFELFVELWRKVFDAYGIPYNCTYFRKGLHTSMGIILIHL